MTRSTRNFYVRLFSKCCLALFVSLLATTLVRADALPLWKLSDTENDVFLMGSIHFLREQDYPLASEIMAAYSNSSVIVMEMDMDDLNPLQAMALMESKGSLADGRTLQSYMGNEAFREAEQKAQALGISLELFGNKKPWYAGLIITQLRLMQLGFDPTWGIEQQMMQRSVRDMKEIQGLETMADQLNALDRINEENQTQFLLQSLDDATEVTQEMNAIVSAWRSGDTQTIEEYMIEGLQELPDLYDSLLVKRNRNWTDQIHALVNNGNDYLIIVGAMHLVGDDSVIAMLEEQGVEAEQLQTGSL